MNTLVSSRGQTVVPSELRRKFGLRARSKLAWIDDGNSMRVVPVATADGPYGRGAAKGLGLSAGLRAARKKERARERRAGAA
jgi:bifunctional DNA-binding transcriptional regulator/antitoxin component of YhaV-PrlF toxin-antitoxin module